MSEVPFVKYCPLCGAENPRQAAFCIACMDGDLSTVPVEPKRSSPVTEPEAPTPRVAMQPEAPLNALRLELVENPAINFAIGDGQTVGRSAKADVVLDGVPNLDYISGCHARFYRDGAQWFVQHLGSTNFIKVDGEMYRGQEEIPVYDGSVLVLSLTAFRVALRA